MLRVGIIGFGFMGQVHYANWKKIEQAQIAAICDSNPDIIEKTKQAQGNIAGYDGPVDFSQLKVYPDFRKLLEAEEPDAVSITLPTHLHAEFSQTALEAGLHVLCEKPMALNVSQCRQMINAAEQSDKVLMIGHCVRFWPEYAKAKEIIESGRYGKVIAATFRRLGAAPRWGDDNWFMDDNRSGGMAMDMHIHDTDFVQYLFGLPRAVHSFAAKTAQGQLAHIVTEYIFDDNKVVTAEGSWAPAASFGFEMSFNIAMENGTIIYDCTRCPAFKVCPAEGDAFTPQVDEVDGYYRQIAHFAGLVGGEKVPQVTTLEQSMNSVMIVKAEIESAHKHKPVLLEMS